MATVEENETAIAALDTVVETQRTRIDDLETALRSAREDLDKVLKRLREILPYNRTRGRRILLTEEEYETVQFMTAQRRAER